MGGQVAGIPKVQYAYGIKTASAEAVGMGQQPRHGRLTRGRPSGPTTTTPKAEVSKYTSQSLRMASALYPGSTMVSSPFGAGELGFPRQKKKEELGATAPTGAGTMA